MGVGRDCMGHGMVDNRSDSVRMVEGLPLNLCAVDPGEEHVGSAIFHNGKLTHVDTSHPDAAIPHLWEGIEAGLFDVVVAELWRNYDNKPITWSDCRTAEVIGAMRYMCARHGVSFVVQPAIIKRPAIARMERYGLMFPAGSDRHARDAVKHGYWYLFEHGLTPGQTA